MGRRSHHKASQAGHYLAQRTSFLLEKAAAVASAAAEISSLLQFLLLGAGDQGTESSPFSWGAHIPQALHACTMFYRLFPRIFLISECPSPLCYTQ